MHVGMCVAVSACIVCLLILHVCSTGSSATYAGVSDSVFVWILSLAISRAFL